MRKYIFALIFGFGIVFHGQSVHAQADNLTLDGTHTVDKNILADEELMKTITPEQLEEYISRGADVNIKFTRKTKDLKDENKIIEAKEVTPLMMAALGNTDKKVIEILLENGADIQARNENEKTAFIYAAQENSNPKVIETLLKHGANIEAKDKYGATALMYAAEYNQNPEVIETLLKHGTNIEAKNKIGTTALMFAAADNQNPEIIETLLKHGANIEAKNNRGVTALMFATANNKNPEIIETLLKHGANIEAKNNRGGTALTHAAEYNQNPEIIETLLKHGANIEAKDKDGWTPLMFAAQENSNPEIIEILLKHGANIEVSVTLDVTYTQTGREAKDRGYTVFLLACRYSHNLKNIETLIKHGANTLATTSTGNNGSDLLYWNTNVAHGKLYDSIRKISEPITSLQSEEIMRVITPKYLEKIIDDFDVNEKKSYDDKTPLMYAAQYTPYPEIIEILLKHGANIEARDKTGWTALMHAAGFNQNLEVIETLIKHGAIIRDGNQLLELLAENEKIEKNQDYWDLRDRIYDKISR